MFGPLRRSMPPLSISGYMRPRHHDNAILDHLQQMLWKAFLEAEIGGYHVDFHKVDPEFHARMNVLLIFLADLTVHK